MSIKSRLELHQALVDILGTKEVYYQPPSSIQMKYPAIVYSRADIRNTSANNKTYIQKHVYTITVMDRNPDSPIVEAISKLPNCRYDRPFKADNINHDVFTIVTL